MLKGVSKKRGLFLFLDTPSVFISGIWQNATNSLQYFTNIAAYHLIS